jgi:hypothetical protein
VRINAWNTYSVQYADDGSTAETGRNIDLMQVARWRGGPYPIWVKRIKRCGRESIIVAQPCSISPPEGKRLYAQAKEYAEARTAGRIAIAEPV